MSEHDAGLLRTLAFGDLDAGVWGLAWGVAQPLVAIGPLAPDVKPMIAGAELAGATAEQDWGLSGDGVHLTVSAESDASHSPLLEGFDQLCRVRGTVAFAGTSHTVDALGRRSARSNVNLADVDSIRDVCAWFPAGHGAAVTSLRARRAHGHDADVIVGSVFDGSGALDVADPRLSTTYGADGSPLRAGFELWLDHEDAEEQYPRRAAGEALGASVVSARNGLHIEGCAFRWHSRGDNGAGVYVLARAA